MHLCFQTCVRIVLLASSSFLLQVFAVPSAFFWSWSFWCFFFGDAFVLGNALALGNAFALAFALGMAFAALLLGALRASFFPGLLSFPGPGFMRLRRVFSGGLSPSVSGWGSVRLSSISGVTGWDLDGASILGGIRLVSGVAGLANPGVSSWFVSSLTSGWFTSGWGSSEIPGSSKIPGLSQSSGKSPSFGLCMPQQRHAPDIKVLSWQPTSKIFLSKVPIQQELLLQPHQSKELVRNFRLNGNGPCLLILGPLHLRRIMQSILLLSSEHRPSRNGG